MYNTDEKISSRQMLRYIYVVYIKVLFQSCNSTSVCDRLLENWIISFPFVITFALPFKCEIVFPLHLKFSFPISVDHYSEFEYCF